MHKVDVSSFVPADHVFVTSGADLSVTQKEMQLAPCDDGW